MWEEFWKDDSGMGTVEVVLILVVLVSLVVIFKGEITTLVNNVFASIQTQAADIYEIE